MSSTDKSADYKKTVGRNARWSLVQTVVAAFTVFILYKYLYAHLGPEQLGLWAVVLASVSLGRLAELGFSTTILRYVSMHSANGDKERAARILETGLISIGGPFALVLLALCPFANLAMRYVVPSSNLDTAVAIFPFALGTLWFGVVGAIAQSALDGCGRMDVKSRILILGNLAYVPAAIFMVQRWGILGLAVCQLLQSILVAMLVWIASRRELPALRWVPLDWNKSCFHEILGYAAGLQIGNLLLMLFEPATKILLSRYCGLHEVAHFEMANQVVSRVRALITSAIQAYLPVLSSSGDNTSAARQVVGDAMIFTVGIGVPVMAAMVVSFPFVSSLWIGQVQTEFITYGWILGVGWLVSTLAMPVFFYCVGTGRVRTVLWSQAIMVGLNAVLGLGAAMLGLGHWVALSMMVALAVGNLVIVQKALVDLQVTFQQIRQSAAARSVIKTIAFTILVMISSISLSMGTTLGGYLYINFVVHVLFLLAIAYLSDARGILTARYRRAQ